MQSSFAPPPVSPLGLRATEEGDDYGSGDYYAANLAYSDYSVASDDVISSLGDSDDYTGTSNDIASTPGPDDYYGVDGGSDSYEEISAGVLVEGFVERRVVRIGARGGSLSYDDYDYDYEYGYDNRENQDLGDAQSTSANNSQNKYYYSENYDYYVDDYSGIGATSIFGNIEAYLGVAEKDGDEWPLHSTLLDYAASQLGSQLNTIISNLEQNNVHTVDVLFPPYGNNFFAAGGMYEVLGLLVKRGIIELGNIMGASGGASAALLLLADGNWSSRTMLKYHGVYNAYLQDTYAPMHEDALWKGIYTDALRDPEAFKRVREKAWIACLCGREGERANEVFTGFRTREQAVQATTASGDFISLMHTIQDHTNDAGTVIPGWEGLGRCHDGGMLSEFPGSLGRLVFFNFNYGQAHRCDTKCLDDLYRKGVDETIALLGNKAFQVQTDGGYGGMEMIRSKVDAQGITQDDFAKMQYVLIPAGDETVFRDGSCEGRSSNTATKGGKGESRRRRRRRRQDERDDYDGDHRVGNEEDDYKDDTEDD
jgi:hypothetical protein